ncbi:MAG: hypothetical protein ACK5HT_03175, partial [Draconibacterium sp.]
MAFTPIVVNANTFQRLKHNTDSISYFRFATHVLQDNISAQVSNELSIVDILPDSVQFNFDQLVKRKMKVAPAVSYTLVKQHFLSGDITFVPDSVDVLGPRSILDTLDFIKTEEQHYKNLDQPVQRNVAISNPANLSTTPKRVVMNIPVEEFTEKKIEVPITVANLPDSLDVKLFPNQAILSFLVGLSKFADISADNFDVVVDYNEIS